MSKTASWQACVRCGRAVLYAPYDHQMGMPSIGVVHLDPYPLGQSQILACVIADVPLWQVAETRRGVTTSARFPGWPKGPMPGFVLPLHACERVWRGLPPLELTLDKAATPSPETCPF